MDKDWIPCKAETIRSTIGEIFLVAASNVKEAFKSAIDIVILPPFNINADLWTSKVTGEKFLGLRVSVIVRGLAVCRFRYCTRFGSVSRADQCRLDR